MLRLGAAMHLLIMLGAVTGSTEPAQEVLREMVKAHAQKFPPNRFRWVGLFIRQQKQSQN